MRPLRAVSQLVAGAFVLVTLASCGGSSRTTTVAAPHVRFAGLYGARLHRCTGAQGLQRGGSDLRVIRISCQRARQLAILYGTHPTERLESVTTFGCYAHRPRTGLAAQRVVCIDSASARAFRFDIG